MNLNQSLRGRARLQAPVQWIHVIIRSSLICYGQGHRHSHLQFLNFRELYRTAAIYTVVPGLARSMVLIATSAVMLGSTRRIAMTAIAR
jgi:hypothetical protein